MSPITFAAGAGLIGLGMNAGSNVGCVLGGILGGCGTTGVSTNKQAIVKTVDYVNKMQKQWSKVIGKNSKKLFVLGSLLTHLRKHQNEISDIQNTNNMKIKTQIDIFKKNIHLYRNCHQYFYTRTSLNHHMISLQGVLSTLYTIAKTFRSALYTFKSNLFQNLGHMANGYLPMALFPKDSLEAVLKEIGSQQQYTVDMLSLAIPLSSVLSYYEIPLLKSVQGSEIGIHFTLAIPMATQSTVLNVFRARTIPCLRTTVMRLLGISKLTMLQ